MTSLGTSGVGDVVHDVKVPEVGGSGRGGTRVPLVGDTLLGMKKNSVEQQSYQRISAETVCVGDFGWLC